MLYRRFDYILVISFAVLLIFGLLTLSSAGVVIGYQKFNDSYYLLKHQIFYGLIPGLFLFFLAYKINYRKWKKISIFLLILNILFLAAVFIPKIGVDFDKAKSWIKLGFFTFQPSEFIKLSLILYLAAYLGKKGKEMCDFKKGLFPFLAILGLISFLIIKQPDLGTASIIIIISCLLYFSANTPIRDIVILILLGAAMLFLLIKIAPYRVSRFEVFLNPESDPQDKAYQINQALLAIGSGGIFGRGLGLSIQKFQYLPEPAGDSIFAVIGEELGFVFSFLLVTLFLVLSWRGFKIAKKCKDEFGRLAALGISFMFIIQAFVNIGGMVGLIPLTGVPLPLVSYGGSALVTYLTGTGVLFNISKNV